MARTRQLKTQKMESPSPDDDPFMDSPGDGFFDDDDSQVEEENPGLRAPRPKMTQKKYVGQGFNHHLSNEFLDSKAFDSFKREEEIINGQLYALEKEQQLLFDKLGDKGKGMIDQLKQKLYNRIETGK